MSIFAWYDIPAALLAGFCVYLAYQDWQRASRNFFRRADLYLTRSERRMEDFYWAMYRTYEAAEAELIYVNRKIESYVNGTAEIERPREATSHLKEVI